MRTWFTTATADGRLRARTTSGRIAIALLLAIICTDAFVGNVLATPSSGLTQTVKGPCSFAPFDVRVQGMPPSWRVHLRTQGQSDVYYVDNVFAPGASTGWHSHPGPSFVLVVSGTVTNYEGGSGHCTITRYSAGSGFMDEGGNGNDVHMIKNDTAEPAETIALQSSPRAPRGGSTSRIPAPARGSRNQPEW